MVLTLKDVMVKTERIKSLLHQRYEIEYEHWRVREAARLAREQEEAEERRRMEISDRNAALHLQRELDQEREQEQLNEALRLSKLDDDSRNYVQEQPSAPPPYSPSTKPKSAYPSISGVSESSILSSIQRPSIPQPQRPAARKYSEIPGPQRPSSNYEDPSYDGGAPCVPDRSKKPSLNESSQSGLKSMTVPTSILQKFLNAAQRNTSNNIETLGILGGKLSKKNFVITHVILPKQTGTSHSCSMSGEEELIDYHIEHDLLTLGWIHTHPSQTAFLSSIDLHCQHGYERILPEALAIVCAPKYQETGFFTLPPHGFKLIGACKEDGTRFHEHPQHPALFHEGTHLVFNEVDQVKVVDLR